MNIFVWVYFLVLYPVLLIYVSILTLIPHSIKYCSYIVWLHIRQTNSLHFILLFQDDLCYSKACAFPYNFFFFFCHTTQHAGSQFLNQGSNLRPLQQEHGVLTAGPPGNSSIQIFFFSKKEPENQMIYFLIFIFLEPGGRWLLFFLYIFIGV